LTLASSRSGTHAYKLLLHALDFTLFILFFILKLSFRHKKTLISKGFFDCGGGAGNPIPLYL
jgi:hypothetical protein